MLKNRGYVICMVTSDFTPWSFSPGYSEVQCIFKSTDCKNDDQSGFLITADMHLPRPQSLAITFWGISELIIDKSGSERSAGKGRKSPLSLFPSHHSLFMLQ